MQLEWVYRGCLPAPPRRRSRTLLRSQPARWAERARPQPQNAQTALLWLVFFRSQAAFILPHVSSPPSTPSVSLCLSPFCFSLCLPSRQACFMLCRMFIIRQCCSRGLSILSIKNMSCCSLTPIVVESQFCSLSMGVSGEKRNHSKCLSWSCLSFDAAQFMFGALNCDY